MIQDSFLVRTTTVHVFIDDVNKEDAYIEFEKAAVTYRCGIKAIPIIKRGKLLPIEYYRQVFDLDRSLLAASTTSYNGNLHGEYDEFYASTTVGTTIGVDFDKAALNGLMEVVLRQELGERAFCYHPYNGYAYFQPVIFDLVASSSSAAGTAGTVAVNDTISVTIVNGPVGAVYEYSLDSGPYSSNSIFGNLVAGSYTVSVRTVAEAIPFHKSITI